MNKLKMLALTAMAAATIGVGGLAAAPSASAMPAEQIDCTALKIKWQAYQHTAIIFNYIGDYMHAEYFFGLADAYGDVVTRYC